MSNRFRQYLLFAAFGFCSQLHGQVQVGPDIDGEAIGNLQGWSVCMPDAQTVGVGAPRNSGGGNWAGHVRIHTWNGSTWVQKGSDIDGKAADEGMGLSISMPDANTVAIGSLDATGLARVYAWDGNAWLQKGADFVAEAFYDKCGYSVSMPDPNTVAIGSPRNNGAGSDAGNTRIYTWDGTAWVQKGMDIDGEFQGDESGTSVSMPDVNTVAIGAPYNSGGGVSKGHVRVYAWDGAAWIQKGSDINGEGSSDESGFFVSMPDANTLAIGAKFNAGGFPNSGHVRVYGWDGNAWTQKGGDIDGAGQGDQFGRSVSMPDADHLAVGAPYGDGNGQNAGAVYLYAWNGSAWVASGNGLAGEAAGDGFGMCVNMPDANTVAVGAPFNDVHGQESGHARVFSLLPTGMHETNASPAFSVHPNPTQKRLRIAFKEGHAELRIRIAQLNGTLVSEKRYSFAEVLELDLEGAPGVYLLQVLSSGIPLGNVKVMLQ